MAATRVHLQLILTIWLIQIHHIICWTSKPDDLKLSDQNTQLNMLAIYSGFIVSIDILIYIIQIMPITWGVNNETPRKIVKAWKRQIQCCIKFQYYYRFLWISFKNSTTCMYYMKNSIFLLRSKHMIWWL